MLEYKHKIETRKLRSSVKALKVQTNTGEWELSYDVEAKKEEIGRYMRDRVEKQEAREEV